MLCVLMFLAAFPFVVNCYNKHNNPRTSENDAVFLGKFLNKRYVMEEIDIIHYKPILELLGINNFTRSAILAVKPVITLAFDGENYTFNREWYFVTITSKFKLWEPYATQALDGRNITTIHTRSGDHELTTYEVGEKTAVIKMEFGVDEIQVQTMVDDLVCHHVYRLVPKS